MLPILQVNAQALQTVCWTKLDKTGQNWKITIKHFMQCFSPAALDNWTKLDNCVAQQTVCKLERLVCKVGRFGLQGGGFDVQDLFA